MKTKNLFFTLSFLFLFFISCSSDDDASSSVAVTEDALVGTWNLTDFYIDNGQTILDVAGQQFITDYTQQGSNFNYEIVFATGPNTASSSGTYDVEITTIISGQSIVTNQTLSSNDALEGSWSISGSTLTIDNGTDPSNAEIISFNGNQFTMRIDLSQINSQLPAGTTAVGDAYYTLQKAE
jgi:hypothetical protein